MIAQYTPLHEQYRPASWADVIGQDKAIKKIQTLKARGLGGRAYWITGKSGQGKTTIARLLANEIADPFMIQEIDATDLTPAALKELEREAQTMGWGDEKPGRAFIVNEAHGLRRDTIRQLLVWIERLPGHAALIFTTTRDGQEGLEELDDSAPLFSRCVMLPLNTQGLAPLFAQRALTIANNEGLGGKDIKAFERLAKNLGGNMRAMLQAVDTGDMM